MGCDNGVIRLETVGLHVLGLRMCARLCAAADVSSDGGGYIEITRSTPVATGKPVIAPCYLIP